MTGVVPRGRRVRVLMRFITGLVVGVVCGAIAGPLLGFAAGLLAGWAGFALTRVVWTLVEVWPMDADQTRTHATAENPGRRVASLIALIGSVVSLGAVAVVLLDTRGKDEVTSGVLAAIAVLSVAASWALIQVDYMLRVAAMYYLPPEGGVSFNQKEPPMYTDFAYLSVGLGMTYQVADTSLTDNRMRRIVIAQTLLAYLFGAVILATVINLVTGLG